MLDLNKNTVQLQLKDYIKLKLYDSHCCRIFLYTIYGIHQLWNRSDLAKKSSYVFARRSFWGKASVELDFEHFDSQKSFCWQQVTGPMRNAAWSRWLECWTQPRCATYLAGLGRIQWDPVEFNSWWTVSVDHRRSVDRHQRIQFNPWRMLSDISYSHSPYWWDLSRCFVGTLLS